MKADSTLDVSYKMFKEFFLTLNVDVCQNKIFIQIFSHRPNEKITIQI